MNGIELDTKVVRDNPRDMKGVLTLDENINDGSSAGNYGYLIEIQVPENKEDAVIKSIKEKGKIVISYRIKDNARNKNGIRIYSRDTGRYMVSPTVWIHRNEQQ